MRSTRGLWANRVTAAGLVAGLALALATASAGASTSSEKAQAKKALLTKADMPKKWTTEKGSVSGQFGLLGGPSVASCIGDTSNVTGLDLPEVDSKYFQNKAQSLDVQDSIAIFLSIHEAQVEFADLSSPKLAACMTTFANGPYKSQLAANAGKNATAGTITVTSTNPVQYGKGTAGYELDIPITNQGISITVQIISVYFVKGTFGQQITLNLYGASAPTATMRHLVSVAMHRL